MSSRYFSRIFTVVWLTACVSVGVPAVMAGLVYPLESPSRGFTPLIDPCGLQIGSWIDIQSGCNAMEGLDAESI